MTPQTDPFAALERNYSAEDHFDRDPQGRAPILPAAQSDCAECGTPYCAECGTSTGRPCPSYCPTVLPED